MFSHGPCNPLGLLLLSFEARTLTGMSLTDVIVLAIIVMIIVIVTIVTIGTIVTIVTIVAVVTIVTIVTELRG